MLETPKSITHAIRLTFIGKYLERIADHATNVADLWPTSQKAKSSGIPSVPSLPFPTRDSSQNVGRPLVWISWTHVKTFAFDFLF